MVMHGNKQQRDLTFSLMIPSGNRATERSPALFYKQLHHAIAEGISSFIDDEIRLAGDVDRIDGPSCFIAPARDDLMCQGRKILGGAQRRSAGALLYQGSLQGMEEPWEEIGFPEAIAQALSGSLSAIMLHRASIQEALLLAEHRYRSEAWNNRW